MTEPTLIDVDKLSIGMFVCLDLSWLQHPFSFSSFVIQNDEQLTTLRSLGLKQVRIDPAKGKMPVADHPTATARTPEKSLASGTSSAAEKAARIEQNQALRDNIARAERLPNALAKMLRWLVEMRQFFRLGSPRQLGGILLLC